jgi:hypothetical protein
MAVCRERRVRATKRIGVDGGQVLLDTNDSRWGLIGCAGARGPAFDHSMRHATHV